MTGAALAAGLVEHGMDCWGHRFTVLGAPMRQPASRHRRVETGSRLLETRRTLLRSSKAPSRRHREQESRLDGALLDVERPPAKRPSRCAEAAGVGDQRVELAAAQRAAAARALARRLRRGTTQGRRDWKLLALQARDLAKQAWNFELFAVEDSTVVDGKTVTTGYGVTVGKSIGVLLLYAFAYWVFPGYSRRCSA